MTAGQPPEWLDDPALHEVVAREVASMEDDEQWESESFHRQALSLADAVLAVIREYAPRAAQPVPEASVVTEWAVRCHTSTGELHTGRPKHSRSVAQKSGERLTAINGADWWLVTRSRTTYADHVTDWTPADTGADT